MSEEKLGRQKKTTQPSTRRWVQLVCGRSPDSRIIRPPSLPILNEDSGQFRKLSPFTVAGAVPEFHGLPCSADQNSLNCQRSFILAKPFRLVKVNPPPSLVLRIASTGTACGRYLIVLSGTNPLALVGIQFVKLLLDGVDDPRFVF